MIQIKKASMYDDGFIKWAEKRDSKIEATILEFIEKNGISKNEFLNEYTIVMLPVKNKTEINNGDVKTVFTQKYSIIKQQR